MRKDWDSLLTSLHKQNLSPFQAVGDIADWFLEQPVERVKLFDPNVTYRAFCEALGFPEKQWDVAKGLKWSNELIQEVNRRLFGLAANPMKYMAVIENLVASSLSPDARLLDKVAAAKYLEQQHKTLQPAQVAIKNTHSFEVVLRSEASGSSIFRTGDVIDAEIVQPPVLEGKFSTVSNFQVAQPALEEVHGST